MRGAQAGGLKGDGALRKHQARGAAHPTCRAPTEGLPLDPTAFGRWNGAEYGPFALGHCTSRLLSTKLPGMATTRSFWRSMALVTGLMASSFSATAIAQVDASEDLDLEEETISVCVRTPRLGSILAIDLQAELAAVLTQWAPEHYVVLGSEICDGRDNDCDKQIDEGCDPGSGPRCGNGIVEEGEECDDGNRSNQDTCSNECVKLQAPTDNWFAGPQCDRCMESKCAVTNDECLDDAGCREALKCPAQNNCLTTPYSSISCLCGIPFSLGRCGLDSRFNGICAKQILEGLGNPEGPEVFRNYLTRDNGQGLANRAFACMTSQCRSECDDNFNIDLGLQ